MLRWCLLAVLFAACGRTTLSNGLKPQVSAGTGGAPSGDARGSSTDSTLSGGSIADSGGAIATGGAGTGGISGIAGAPAGDDPTTLGNELPGKVECWGSYGTSSQTMTVCDAPKQCCARTGQCLQGTDACSWGRRSCDGDEDCAVGTHCCRGGNDPDAFSCEKLCTLGSIRHLPCDGECADFDRDGIPDTVDLCPTTEREDGKGPFTEDGCRDTDADGVRNELDGCPAQLENGLAPNPNDGCL